MSDDDKDDGILLFNYSLTPFTRNAKQRKKKQKEEK
jgi:hypothetical protein